MTKTHSCTDTTHVRAVTGVSSGWEFSYDQNGNMIYRDDGTVRPPRLRDAAAYTQTFDIENQLVAVFVYPVQVRCGRTGLRDGDGVRVKVMYPDSTTVVYVGDHYEAEGSTTRSYYFFSGKRVALRVQEGANDDVYWFHQDHLGSTSALSDESVNLKTCSTTRYYPYGEYRTTPTQELTDVGYTGHSLRSWRVNRALGSRRSKSWTCGSSTTSLIVNTWYVILRARRSSRAWWNWCSFR